jgi:phosphatidylserine decarboxylase
LQFSIVDPTNASATPEELIEKFKTFVGDHAFGDDDDEELDTLISGDLDEEDEEHEYDENEEDASDETDDPTKPESIEKKKKKLRLARLRKKKKARAYKFSGGSDVVGIVYLEIQKITDLPPERNSMSSTLRQDFETDES